MKKCRICRGGDFKEVLDMGDQPLVNSLLESPEDGEMVFPLLVEQCQDCKLVQVTEPVDSHAIYTAQDYLYYSGDMPGLQGYFQEYVDSLKKYYKERDFVVEIGSNDGTMLKLFEGVIRLGVDPSTNVVVRATANGIPTISAGFNERLAGNILDEFFPAKIIYGNNCIAHIDDLHGVMKGVELLLEKDGIFVVECNYWGGMVKNKNYSLVYHDHFSYFTIKDWMNLAEEYNLTVFDAIITPAQGGSLRIFLSKNKRHMTDRMVTLIQEEEGLSDYETCKKYNKECRAEAKKLGDEIRKLKKEGKTIAGYGAAAKGFSIISLAGITDEIDFYVDDSPAKQGKFTPVNHIPVVSRGEREDPDVFVITAPNYADIIKEKEKDFKGIWITP